MSFFHLEDIDQHRHHPYFQIRNDEHRYMDSGGSTVIRSYDCVFCQRGFTTAQALGGHMNIHRKDRANPASKPNKEPTNNNATILSNKEILLLEEDDHQVDDVVPNNTRLFYSQDHINNGGTSSFDGRLHSFLGSDKFEDHSLMSSRGTSPHHMLGKRIHDHAHAHAHTMEGEELDLELRLGHYSW